ncbi:GDSL esterase/lipase [Forsythia ovata]|uniref:GDSL esterase/lipase n=1 Tax=Forsythia ovata TaxID=205694 RepID=A0ABD1U6K8_9LAMI
MTQIKWLDLMLFGALLQVAVSSSGLGMAQEAQFSAMFVFGDSLIDPGNNNYLNSLAKANYVPYGVDFYQGPSGRFSNGRTIIDYLGDLMEIPDLPAYTNPFATGKNILRGVNYASAAGGILEETGQNLGERFSLSDQVHNFENTLNQLKSQMINDQELSNYLAKALALHSLGLRKFFIGGIGPLGCIPNQLAIGLAPPGKCVAFTNEVVGMFNMRLIPLVDQLNSNYNDSVFTYGNTFGAFYDILNNSKAYGFSVIDRGCCGVGRNQGQITCLPFSVPCVNRNQYIFWDAFHPTQAVNQILARRAYTGPTSDCYPVNVQQMAQF